MPTHKATEKLWNAQNCHQYASFFHNLPGLYPFWLMLLLHIVIVILTAILRSITPGLGGKAATVAPASSDVEVTAIPNTQTDVVAEESSAADEPPPYQPPATETATPAPPTPKIKRSSAHSFVVGSAVFVPVLTSLIFLALDIQAVIFCSTFSPVSTFPRIINWVLYSLTCLWASTGVSCWMMLFRDLWGPGMKEKYPIREGYIAIRIVSLPLVPFIMIGMGLVNAIQACQRRFCSDALEEESEDAEQGIELGQESLPNVDEDGEASESRDEESMGLMTAMK